MHFIPFATRARLAALAWLFTAALAWAAPPQLLDLQPPTAASGGNRPADIVSRGRPAHFNRAQMFALAPGQEADLTLPDGTQVPYVLDLKQDHGGGIRTWIGRHRDRGNLYRAVVTTGPNGSYGVFETPNGEFRLVPGNGTDVLIDMKAEAASIPPIEMGPDNHVPVPGGKSLHPSPLGTPPQPFIPLPGVNSVALPKVAPTPVYDLDLMIVYTRGLQRHLRGNLMTRLYFIVARLNTAYSDSEAAIRLRLVHTVGVDYPDNTTDNQALFAISPQCATAACGGPFDAATFGDIENQRTTYGADLALLARDGNTMGGSGVSWVGFTTYRPAMYSVVTGCVLACEWVFMHELGHQMGLQHDRPTMEWQSGGTATPPTGKYSYSYGYAYCSTGTLTCDPTRSSSSGGCVGEPECSTNDASNFGDVMSYFSGSTFRNYRFSNPDISCVGSNGVAHSCGVPAGQADEADAALSVNNYRSTLAATVSTTEPDPLPGSVQFAKDAFAGIPSTGSVTLEVARLGGAGGPLQVSYRTVDGSALAGRDYTASTGTLSWADGDSANKVIQVPLVNPSATESRMFTVELYGASGSGPVDVAYPNVATVLAAAPWPVSSAVPEGLQPIGAWSVAQDSAFEGTSSVRSPLARSPDGNTVAWNISFDANFSAGPIAFAYRVSTYVPPYEYFHFDIDGQEVFRDSGESGWQVFVYPLTAGHHFLSWTIVSELTTPCSQLSGSPGGTSCADRLWLDSLALPAFTPTRSSSAGITASPNPSTGGQNVTITAVVSGSAGAPGGSVDFRDGGSSIAGCSAIALVNGVANCVTSRLASGSHSLTAAYAGDAIYLGSTSSAWQQTVNGSPPKLDASVALASSANPIVEGQSTTLNASVSGSTPAPTGSVSFLDGSTTLCGSVAIAGGTASCVASGLAAGTHSIVASYSGDGQYNAASSAALNQVVQAPPPQAGSIALAPTSLDFGAESMGTTSPPQAVLVTNTGNASATIGAVSTAGPFAATTDCTTLAPGASCTVTVTFSPAPADGALNASIPMSGSLGVTSDAPGSPNTAALSGSAEKSLVTHYYRSILRRPPDQAGHDFWESEAARVAGLGANVNETWYALALSFFNSPEYASFNTDNAGYLTDLYLTFFNRAPDSAGFSYWLDQMAQGMPREGVLANFMFSPEFRNFTEAIFGNTSVRPEFDISMDMYRGTLARLPDNAGFNFYLGEFRKAQCQSADAVRSEANTVSSGFLNSPEYGNRQRTNAQYMADLYNTFMRRGPDTAGIKFYIGQLDSGAQTREQIRQQFVSSPEFSNRVTNVANAGCMQ